MSKLVNSLLRRLASVFFKPVISTPLLNYDTISKVLNEDERDSTDRSATLPVNTRLVTETEAAQLKRQHFEEMLDHGITSIVLDATCVGVEVPDSVRGNQSLLLNFSYNYNIDDFKIDDNGIVASLSFNRSRYRCVIPWAAISAIGSEAKGSYFTFTSGELQHPAVQQSNQKEPTPAQRRKGFKLIQGGKE